MAQNKFPEKIDDLIKNISNDTESAVTVTFITSEVANNSLRYDGSWQYDGTQTYSGIKYQDYKFITDLIDQVKSLGYEVSIQDEKRIVYFINANPILEGMLPSIYIDTLVKELGLKEGKKVLASKLFQDSNLTVNSSSRIMDIFFCFCVSKNLSLKEIVNISKVSHTYSKIYKETEKLDLVFREIEATLTKEYGIETYSVFSLLVCYYAENIPLIINNEITVYATDLLSYLRKKYNLYRENNLVKRNKLEDNFSWLANQLDLLTIPRLICPRISPYGKGKEDFRLENTALIEIKTSYKSTKQGVFDLTKIPDMTITYSIPWFENFNSKKYLLEYGYTHREAFSSSGVKSALLHWLNNKLEQNQDGDFRIRTIIVQIGLKDKLEAINSETDSKKRRNLEQDLFRILMSVLTEIKEIPDPYQWEYKNAPQWLIDKTRKKPRGWFENSWLDVVIIFKHPKCLIAEGKEYRREKIKEVTPEPKLNKLTVTDLKSALAQYSDNKNVSLRKLAEAYGTSQPTLSRKLKSGKFNQFELRDLIKWTHILGKKKK